MDENRFARSLDSKYTNTATNTSTATSTAGQMPMEFLAGAVIHEGQFTIPHEQLILSISPQPRQPHGKEMGKDQDPRL